MRNTNSGTSHANKKQKSTQHSILKTHNWTAKQTAKLDPRTKIISMLVFSSLAVLLSSLSSLACLFLLALLIGLLLSSPRQIIRKALTYLLPLGLLFSFIYSVAQPGDAWLALGSVTILGKEGVMMALRLVLRMMVIITSAAWLVGESPRRLVQGLIQWRLPYEIAFMVVIGLRFLPLLREEMSGSLTVIQLRGVDLRRLPLCKYISVYTYLLLPVLAQAIFRARQLSLSLELRGFRAYPKRSSFFVLKLSRYDYLGQGGAVLFLVLVLLAHGCGTL